MKGIVQVFKDFGTENQEMVLEKHNMIMDNFGEIITDIFTIPNYLDTIDSVSSLLDTSNYTIGAISFSPTPLGFVANSRNIADSLIAVGASGVLTSQFTTVGYTSGLNVSSPYVLNGFVSALQPWHQTLLWDFKTIYNPAASGTSGVASNQYMVGVKPPVLGGTSANYAVQRIPYDLGQHPNWIQYNSNIPMAKKYPPDGFTQPLPESSSIALRALSQGYGAFPHSSGTQYALFDGPAITDIVIPSSILEPFPTYKSLFNTVSSMDFRGFVRAYWAKNVGSNPFSSGLIVSTLSTFSSTGELKCVITVSASDLALVNYYGGIYQMGLWCIDPVRTLLNGVNPPFAWVSSNGVTQREFKLLSKMQLQDNLAKIQDFAGAPGSTNYNNLVIVWTLGFI